MEYVYLLGQGFFVHACSIRAAPWQGLPPWLGVGFVQDRENTSTPVPQDTLHGIDNDQGVQPP